MAELAIPIKGDWREVIIMNKFFDEKEEKPAEEEEQEEEKISLGDTEFTAEELQTLVGKAKAVSEFEEKQGQSWDDVTKSWGKRGERIGEYKRQVAELQEKIAQSTKPQEVLDEEQVAAQIKAEAKKHGFVLHDEVEREITKVYNKLRQGEKTLAEVNRVVKLSARKGYPKIKPDELLEYMNDPNNPADPQNAYDQKFKKEIREIDQQKLAGIRKPGMVTEAKSTAGSKEYKAPKVTKGNLSRVLKEHFEEGGE